MFVVFLMFWAGCLSSPLAKAEVNALPDSIINEDAVYEYTFTDYDKACRIMKELRSRGNLPSYTLDMTEGDLYYNTGILIRLLICTTTHSTVIPPASTRATR